ncbi:MAG: DUF885 family protein [Allomuricauda sp.]
MYKLLKGISIWLVLLASIAASAQTSKLADLIDEFRADDWGLNHVYIMKESEEYYQRFSKFYEDWSKRMDDLEFGSLSQQEKVDYILLKNLVTKGDYFLSNDYNEFKAVANVMDLGKELVPFIQERRRGKKPDSKQLAGHMQDAAKAIAAETEARKNKPFKDWQTAEKASNVVLSFQKTLEEAYEFYYGYDPDFTWWVEQPFKSLNENLKAYAEFLKNNYSENSVKDDGSGIIGKPIGKAALMESLAMEFIPYTPEQLIQTAEKQFDWCKKEMIKASRELGYGDDWKAALEHVKNTYVPAGEQPQASWTCTTNRSISLRRGI